MTQRTIDKRSIKRNIDLARLGKPGGICPKCGSEPLHVLEPAQPAEIPVCVAPKCGWRSPKLGRFMVFVHQPKETEAKGLIVWSDCSDNAVKRGFRLGLIRIADEVKCATLAATSLVPDTWMDRLLSGEEMDALATANQPTPA